MIHCGVTNEELWHFTVYFLLSVWVYEQSHMFILIFFSALFLDLLLLKKKKNSLRYWFQVNVAGTKENHVKNEIYFKFLIIFLLITDLNIIIFLLFYSGIHCQWRGTRLILCITNKRQKLLCLKCFFRPSLFLRYIIFGTVIFLWVWQHNSLFKFTQRALNIKLDHVYDRFIFIILFFTYRRNALYFD
jgi:hypothetical protein